MTTKTKAEIRIDLDDVCKAGGVAEAIFERCQREDSEYGSGYLQSPESAATFSIQWHDGSKITDYARTAMVAGALHYIDHSDGRMINAVAVNKIDGDYYTEHDGEEVDEDSVHRDFGGGDFVMGDWSDESVVELICPSIEEALEHSAEAAEMAQAVIDTHGARSDKAEWLELVKAIQAAGEAFEKIDASDLED